mmetsp:Transcript_63471/g.183958  ORF Transcript_63471/g.183958 Transcript_63471/m.183958 type:complete len:528 (+) Transcript_63471:84-1667(+)|eukprot:CAMPEP_0170229622 /NCGR_PEP_ID=MMETSP0116_2-20130129/14536_1 /TAXON_ID=400756 /ORGANISM="Durinskia baltica, Strain CSIRO CS-38" /LENGTH=527 /DNA_ID=CAMNT_0010480375 /DNA_START=81 /DNA_END=1664 /DNA_ORIENTATION=+
MPAESRLAMDPSVRVTVACATAVGAACLLVRACRRSRQNESKRPPCAGGQYGNLLHLLRMGSMTRACESWREKYGDVYFAATPVMPNQCIVMDIDAMQKIIALDAKLGMTLWMPQAYETIRGAKDLQLLSGSAHKHWLRVLNPTVSPRALDSYAPRLYAAFADMWRRAAAKDGEVIILNIVQRTKLRAMADIFYGLTMPEGDAALDQMAKDFELCVNGSFAIPINLPGMQYRKALKASARIRGMLRDILRQELRRRAEARESAPVQSPGGGAVASRKPLRSAVEAIAELSESADQSIRDSVASEDLVVANLMLLLEAAHNTSSFATTALLCELHSPGNEARLAKARGEAAEHLKRTGGVDAAIQPTTTEFQGLPYINACIDEVLRIYRFVGSIPKDLLAGQSVEAKGYTLEGPMTVTVQFGNSFLDPVLFPRPVEFLPERWLPDAPSDIAVSETARRAFLPFGFGAHICLGKNLARTSIKLSFLAMVAGGFEVELVGPLERAHGLLPEVVVKGGGLARVTKSTTATT